MYFNTNNILFIYGIMMFLVTFVIFLVHNLVSNTLSSKQFKLQLVSLSQIKTNMKIKEGHYNKFLRRHTEWLNLTESFATPIQHNTSNILCGPYIIIIVMVTTLFYIFLQNFPSRSHVGSNNIVLEGHKYLVGMFVCCFSISFAQ